MVPDSNTNRQRGQMMVILGEMLELDGRRPSVGPNCPKLSAHVNLSDLADYDQERPVYCPSNSTVSSNCVSEASTSAPKMCQFFSSICKIRFCLALGQCLIGIVVSVLGLYAQTHTPPLRTRDTPYWAGVIVSTQR